MHHLLPHRLHSPSTHAITSSPTPSQPKITGQRGRRLCIRHRLWFGIGIGIGIGIGDLPWSYPQTNPVPSRWSPQARRLPRPQGPHHASSGTKGGHPGPSSSGEGVAGPLGHASHHAGDYRGGCPAAAVQQPRRLRQLQHCAEADADGCQACGLHSSACGVLCTQAHALRTQVGSLQPRLCTQAYSCFGGSADAACGCQAGC